MCQTEKGIKLNIIRKQMFLVEIQTFQRQIEKL